MEQTTKLSEQKYRVEKTSGYVGLIRLTHLGAWVPKRSPQWSVLTTDDRLGVVFDDENTATIVCSMLNAEARAAAPQVGGGGIREAVQKFAHDFCGKWANTFSSHDSVAVVIELREAIEKFLRSHGLFSPADQLVKAGPVVTHLNMDPDASEETRRAVAEMVNAAYRYNPPVTAEEAEDYLRSEGIDPEVEKEHGRNVIAGLRRDTAVTKAGDAMMDELLKCREASVDSQRREHLLELTSAWAAARSMTTTNTGSDGNGED